MEAKGAPALAAIVTAQNAIEIGSVEMIEKQLARIVTAIVEMQRVLKQMPQHCDPYIFYHRVRPFLAGWPKDGVVYEGISDVPQQFIGGSAAQSSLVQTLDAGLGIQHTANETHSFLKQMRSYMPPKHRQFIVDIESGPSIRQFVIDHKPTDPTLSDLYNNCVEELMNFRKLHLVIAAQYILQQAPKEQKGTGGTNFVHFLKNIETQTKTNLFID